jgi:hypothetical protein
VIVVCFAITLTLTGPVRPLVDSAFVGEQGGSLPERQARSLFKGRDYF